MEIEFKIERENKKNGGRGLDDKNWMNMRRDKETFFPLASMNIESHLKAD